MKDQTGDQIYTPEDLNLALSGLCPICKVGLKHMDEGFRIVHVEKCKESEDKL